MISSGAMLPPLKMPMWENVSRWARVIDYGLHAAHGKASHGAMRLIGDGAEVGVDVGNQLVDEEIAEGIEVEAEVARRTAGTARTSLTGCATRTRTRTGSGTGSRRCAGTARATGTTAERSATRATTARCAARTRPHAGDAAVGHHNDEGLRLAGGDQVVHDQACVSLAAPAHFILASAVLQIQHRITLARIQLIVGRSVNVAAKNGLGALGIEMHFLQMAVRHILESEKLAIRGRNFNAAAPPACAVKVQAAGVRDLRAIHNDLVVVETFVLRVRVADPCAVRAFGHLILDAAQIEQNALSAGRNNTGAHAPSELTAGYLCLPG